MLSQRPTSYLPKAIFMSIISRINKRVAKQININAKFLIQTYLLVICLTEIFRIWLFVSTVNLDFVKINILLFGNLNWKSKQNAVYNKYLQNTSFEIRATRNLSYIKPKV